MPTPISRTFKMDSRERRIFEAMISNLKSFLDDCDKMADRRSSLQVEQVTVEMSYHVNLKDGDHVQA